MCQQNQSHKCLKRVTYLSAFLENPTHTAIKKATEELNTWDFSSILTGSAKEFQIIFMVIIMPSYKSWSSDKWPNANLGPILPAKVFLFSPARRQTFSALPLSFQQTAMQLRNKTRDRTMKRMEWNALLLLVLDSVVQKWVSKNQGGLDLNH